ncbi:hypothetical protein H0H92_003055 [Tricholoma furcatifolium]|nr:hypothetical protein H0H92_003055 [Tricholoma furcatifolium]
MAELRHRYLTECQAASTSALPQKKTELDPAMDDFINAKAHGFGCRCMPIEVYFENEKADKMATGGVP